MAIFYGRPQENTDADTTQALEQTVIGEEQIDKALATLAKYKDAKNNLDARVVADQEWYRLRHWQQIRQSSPADHAEPTSAWLFNSIMNKHADAMDNYPEPLVRPRERSDEESAKVLESVLPVILEQNDFEQTYSENWWDKLIQGTAVYGVFWNPEKENGLGDIDIRPIDILKIFWEPGITDIQQSRNLFIVELIDTDLLDQQYPEHKGKLKGNDIDVKQYIYDDAVDTSEKSVVVDWYYKARGIDGRTLLHYAKFVGHELLYASENDPKYQNRGFYDHGQYPVIFDSMYPEKGTPAGFGLVSIDRGPQLYIDKLSANILENSVMGTKKRFFVSESTNVNVDDFLDWNNPIVSVSGELNDSRIREITTQPLAPIYQQVLESKIEEMKDTSANRDANSGGATSGITAAAAIAALQEAGNKSSRDIIGASYRSYTKILKMCVELIRQFYDEARSFRITGDMPGQYEYASVSNLYLQDQPNGYDSKGSPLYRHPVFDLKMRAQKRNPFSRMEENERAKELYGMGFFNPERAQEALGALEMMDFEGLEKVKETVSQGQTLLNIVQQQSQQLQQMSQMLGQITGVNVAGPTAGPSGPNTTTSGPTAGPKTGISDKTTAAMTPMTGYGERLAKRSSPSMDATSNAAMPGRT